MNGCFALRASSRSLAAHAPLARIHGHETSFFARRSEMIVSTLTYLPDRYPEFGSECAGLARIFGQLAFASAGCDRPSDARRWARQVLRLSPFQPRVYLALAARTLSMRTEC